MNAMEFVQIAVKNGWRGTVALVGENTYALGDLGELGYTFDARGGIYESKKLVGRWRVNVQDRSNEARIWVDPTRTGLERLIVARDRILRYIHEYFWPKYRTWAKRLVDEHGGAENAINNVKQIIICHDGGRLTNIEFKVPDYHFESDADKKITLHFGTPTSKEIEAWRNRSVFERLADIEDTNTAARTREVYERLYEWWGHYHTLDRLIQTKVGAHLNNTRYEGPRECIVRVGEQEQIWRRERVTWSFVTCIPRGGETVDIEKERP